MQINHFLVLGHEKKIFWKAIDYNPVLVYCRELALGTVSLTGDRAKGDDSKHDSHYNSYPGVKRNGWKSN